MSYVMAQYTKGAKGAKYWTLFSDKRLISPDGWFSDYPVPDANGDLRYDRPERIPQAVQDWLTDIWESHFGKENPAWEGRE